MATSTGTQIHWHKKFLNYIETPQLIIRPIEIQDLGPYTNIFNNTAMQLYRGSFNELRFNTWIERWKAHNFSALTILDKTLKKTEVIGHAILGHGDYEGTREKGWTEIAFILHQAYWNKQYSNQELDIGTKGYEGLGTEVVNALMLYAKEITQMNIPVPGDINSDQLNEIEDKSSLYYENEKLKAVFLPLTEVRATCDKTNMASSKILDGAFKIKEGLGTRKKVEGYRPGYVYSIQTKDL